MAASQTAALGAPPKLLVKGLSVRFGALTALEPTDLSVGAGEFLTLLGPSGSGKSTLLQLVSGLLEPTSGEIFIDGKNQAEVPVYHRDMGMVFQHYALFPHLTVAENIGFPLRMRGLRGGEVVSQVTKVLDMVHLGHLSSRFPRELSGGQQQRVALARCFVYQPSIILMDEPLGALDKKLRDDMQIEIKRLHRQTSATIVYVTHDQEEALAMSDRICLMNHARIEQLGTPHEIYTRPQTEFAANFIGLSTIFRGTVQGKGVDQRFSTDHGTFALPDRLVGKCSAIVVRPEHMTLGSSSANVISGTVREVVYAGSETRLIGTLGGDQEFLVRVPPDQPIPRLGERITASWNPNAAAVLT